MTDGGLGVLMLGRYGDIIQILPAARLAGSLRGQRTNLIVSKDFADVLDGVSYVTCRQYQGPYSQFKNAYRLARSMFSDVLAAQVYRPGDNYVPKTESYTRDSWANLFLEQYYDTEPLIFDRRDHNRELTLIRDTNLTDRSTFLWSGAGITSPFAQAAECRAALLESGTRILDISRIKARRVYDLLGLMDVAGGLITIDTAPLHLAAASGIRVAAFISTMPNLWCGSAPRCRCVASMRYPNARAEVALDFLRELAAQSASDRVLHVFPWHYMKDPDHARHRTARATWTSLYRAGVMRPMPYFDWFSPADNRSLKLPYVSEIFDWAAARATPGQVVLFSNSDVCFLPALVPSAAAAVNRFGCFYNKRVDVPDASKKPSPPFTLFAGADVFAFSAQWWHAHREKFPPDLYVGREGWDAVMKLLMQESGFNPPHSVFVTDLLSYHQQHVSAMSQHTGALLADAGNRNNRSVVYDWMCRMGYSRHLRSKPGHNDYLINEF